jgi:hypothetical protein
MAHRLVVLFNRLIPQASAEGAIALTLARDLVQSNRIETYDDYAMLMSVAQTEPQYHRERLMLSSL